MQSSESVRRDLIPRHVSRPQILISCSCSRGLCVMYVSLIKDFDQSLLVSLLITMLGTQVGIGVLKFPHIAYKFPAQSLQKPHHNTTIRYTLLCPLQTFGVPCDLHALR